MKCVSKHQNIKMFGLKLNKYGWVISTHLKLLVAVARHNLKLAEI